MRRFTDTEKWKDPWFRSLQGAHKLVFLYIVDNCNNAGFYEVDEAMMEFQTGLKKEHIQGAWKGLERGIKGASGWAWVRRFLRHQKNEDLNPENPAHKQIIRQLLDQAERFRDCPEFREFIAPYKGLVSPIGKGLVKEEGGAGETKTGYAIPACFETVDGFTKALGGWIESRKKLKKAPTGQAIQFVVNRLAERPDEAVSALNLAIERGWTTVKWDWFDREKPTNGTKPESGQHGPIRMV